MGGVSKLCLQHTRAVHRENKEIDGAGWSLLRLMGTPKYKANHNGCCNILSLGQKFFCFVLFCFKFLYLFLVCRGLGAGSVCVVCFPPPCFSFAKAHRRNLCLLHDKQKNCPHTVNHEHCFHINSSFGGLFVPFFFHFGLDLVCLKNKIINFQKKQKD